MDKRTLKDLLFEQVARIGKAVASPKRLELLELLAQGEKSVEVLTRELGTDIKLTSAHLKTLKDAQLVSVRREGKYMVYRLSGSDVASLWVLLRSVAEEHLLELQGALAQMVSDPAQLAHVDRHTLLDQARRGEIVMLDVRPETEFTTAHLPFARSMPVADIERRLGELPRDKTIVAYCRGPFCLFADEALAILHRHGLQARKLQDGVSEWAAAGLPLTTHATHATHATCAAL
ncbi:MAG: ArsR/SmtB family transcription factor [Leptothrix ochracea]|uniref:ArsR/SmtB family transcription factor n=1 Tax=Leptothrix ochracea TaxID=735331 RepID=UPI0034E1B751